MSTASPIAPNKFGPIDAVITWVDDRAAGYCDLLKIHAKSQFDLDPSRTRDNLDLLRYGMRSIERYAPWINRVFLLTCRPQLPEWLRTPHPRLTIVHHDEIMPASILPTFNSFAIISHLHLIPGLSDNFLYFEDDMLLLGHVTPASFVDAEGRLVVFEHGGPTPRDDTIRRPRVEKPWNLALAKCNRLLDLRYGQARRGCVSHVPLFISRQRWGEMIAQFPEAVEATRRSRFRAEGNIAPEYLYPHFMLLEGRGVRADSDMLCSSCGYVPLENFWPVTVLGFARLMRHRPKWVTLNDNFGAIPNRMTERIARSFLNRHFPHPSSFEAA